MNEYQRISTKNKPTEGEVEEGDDRQLFQDQPGGW